MADQSTDSGPPPAPAAEAAAEIEIKVKTLSQDVYTLKISPQISVSDLKMQLQERAGMPADRQRLIYRGRVLANETHLGNTGVEDGHTIHLVERPADAPPPSSQPSAGPESTQARHQQHRVAMGAINLPMDGNGGVAGLPDVMNQMLSQMISSMGMGIPPGQANTNGGPAAQEGTTQQAGEGNAQPPTVTAAADSTAAAAPQDRQPEGVGGANVQPGPAPVGVPDMTQFLASIFGGVGGGVPAGATTVHIDSPVAADVGTQPGVTGPFAGTQPGVTGPFAGGIPRPEIAHRVRVQTGRAGRPLGSHILAGVNRLLTTLETTASTPHPQGSDRPRQWPLSANHIIAAMPALSVGLDSMPHQFSQILRSVLENVPNLPDDIQAILNSLPQAPPTASPSDTGAAAPRSAVPQPSMSPGAHTQPGDSQGTASQAAGPAPRQLTPPPDNNVAIICAAVSHLISRCTSLLEQHTVSQMQRTAEDLMQIRSRERVQSLNLHDLSAVLLNLGTLLLELSRLVAYLHAYSQGIVAPLTGGPPQSQVIPLAQPGGHVHAHRTGPHVRVSVQQPGGGRATQQNVPQPGNPVSSFSSGTVGSASHNQVPRQDQAEQLSSAAMGQTAAAAGVAPGEQAPQSRSAPPGVVGLNGNPMLSVRHVAPGSNNTAGGVESLSSHPLPFSAFPSTNTHAQAAPRATSASAGRGHGSAPSMRAGLGGGLPPRRGHNVRSGAANSSHATTHAQRPVSGPNLQTSGPAGGEGGGDLASIMMSMLNGPGGQGLMQMASQLAESPAVQRMARQWNVPPDSDNGSENVNTPADESSEFDLSHIMSSMMPVVQGMLRQGMQHETAGGVDQNGEENIEPSTGAEPGAEAPSTPDIAQLMNSMMPMVQGVLGQIGAQPNNGNMSSDGQARSPPQSPSPIPPTPHDPTEIRRSVDTSAWRAALTADEEQEWEATMAGDMAAIELLEQCVSTQGGSLSDAYTAGTRDPRDLASFP